MMRSTRLPWSQGCKFYPIHQAALGSVEVFRALAGCSTSMGKADASSMVVPKSSH